MSNDEMMDFVKLVVKAIQSDYNNAADTRISLIKVLNEADSIAEKLTGTRIVKRGDFHVLEVIAGKSSLSKIK